MTLSIRDPELFGVTESSVTLSFRVEDASGPVDAPARVLLDGAPRARSQGSGTRHLRIEGLAPGTRHRIAIETAGGEPAAHSPFFPESFETHPAPPGPELASFATLNDLHFGEPRFGGVLTEDGEWGGEHPDWPAARETDTEVPYWRFMNEDAVAEINAASVDFTVIKGDIADRGRPEQFAAARECFAKLDRPHHAFLGNHDHYARLEGDVVDGYALLGQPPAPRTRRRGRLAPAAARHGAARPPPRRVRRGAPRLARVARSRRRAPRARPPSSSCTTTRCRPSSAARTRTRSASCPSTRSSSSRWSDGTRRCAAC